MEFDVELFFFVWLLLGVYEVDCSLYFVCCRIFVVAVVVEVDGTNVVVVNVGWCLGRGRRGNWMTSHGR